MQSNGNSNPVKCEGVFPAHPLPILSLAEKAQIRYTEARIVDANTNQQSVLTSNVMNRLHLALTVALLTAGPSMMAGTSVELRQPSPSPTDENKNSTELFEYETTYTGNSDFKDYGGKFGDGDSLYNDISYAHRFLITGNWYLRLGVEYERYDFNGTNNGLPDHLQAASGHSALEYIVKDFAGAGIEFDPGVYFQDTVTGDAF